MRTGSKRSLLDYGRVRLPSIDRLAPAVLGLAMIAAAALYLRATRGMTFFYDDWNFVLDRQAWNADAFLEPHNEHLMLATAALYKVLFELAGADYAPYRVAVTLEFLVLVGVLFVYARRRVGSGWALVAALLVLFCGAGFEDFLWPVNIGFLTSLLALLGALFALERGDRRGDILAGACVLIALCSSSLGIPIAAGVAVELAAAAWRERKGSVPDLAAVARASTERKGTDPFLASGRWLVVVAPVALYGAWRIGYHPPGELRSENAGKILRFGSDTGAAAAGGLLAVGIDWGRLLLLGVAGVVVWRLAGPGRLTPRLALLLAVPLVLWALTALARAQLNDPGASRYVFVGAVLIVLLAVELGRDAPRLTALKPALPVAALLVLAILGGLLAARDGGRFFRGETTRIGAELAAIELGRGLIADGHQVDPQSPQISAGKYFRAIDAMGESPAWSLAKLRTGPQRERAAADAALARAYGVAAKPIQAAACPRRPPRPAGSELPLAPGGHLVLRAGDGNAELRLRRFASIYGGPATATIPAGQTVEIAVPRDKAPDTWSAKVDGAAVTVCSA